MSSIEGLKAQINKSRSKGNVTSGGEEVKKSKKNIKINQDSSMVS
jgi:hypothetical protein